MKNLFISILTVFTFTVAQGQEKSSPIKESSFKVEGVCNMCKKRIESAALRTKGVKMAEWNKKSQMLKVAYNSEKTSEELIQQTVAKHGHETASVPVDSAAYQKLPDCCRYKDGAECKH